jgi:hypothetical protein
MRCDANMRVTRYPTVNEHVSGGSWKGGSHAIELSGKLYLTPEPTCVRKPEGHVQHIILIILGLRKKVVMLRRKNNVARRAGDGTFTSACHK